MTWDDHNPYAILLAKYTYIYIQYHLVMADIAIEHDHRNSGFSLLKW